MGEHDFETRCPLLPSYSHGKALGAAGRCVCWVGRLWFIPVLDLRGSGLLLARVGGQAAGFCWALGPRAVPLWRLSAIPEAWRLDSASYSC